jgi:membrane protein YqaA with SNARE-associated domain
MNWLFIAFALITQEIVSLNTVLFWVYHYHFHVVLIHILFIVATIIDIVVGFIAGKFVRRKMTHGKIVRFAEKWSARFNSYVGKRGRWVALLIIGNFSFPYINAFLAAWLDMPFVESFIFIFIGNMIWYVSLWLLVLGVASVVPNSWTALAVIVGITLIALYFMKRFKIRKI